MTGSGETQDTCAVLRTRAIHRGTLILERCFSVNGVQDQAAAFG